MPWWVRTVIWALSTLLLAIWIVWRFDRWLENRKSLVILAGVIGSRIKGKTEEYPEGPVITEIRQLALDGEIALSGRRNPNEAILHAIPASEWATTQIDIFTILAGGGNRIDTESSNGAKWHDLHIRYGDRYKLKKRWWFL